MKVSERKNGNALIVGMILVILFSCNEEVGNPEIISHSGSHIMAVEGKVTDFTLEVPSEIEGATLVFSSTVMASRLFEELGLNRKDDGNWELRVKPYCGHLSGTMISLEIRAEASEEVEPLNLQVFVTPDLIGNCIDFFCMQHPMIGTASELYTVREHCSEQAKTLEEKAITHFDEQCERFCQSVTCYPKKNSSPPSAGAGCVLQQFRDAQYAGFAYTAPTMCTCVKTDQAQSGRP